MVQGKGIFKTIGGEGTLIEKASGIVHQHMQMGMLIPEICGHTRDPCQGG